MAKRAIVLPRPRLLDERQLECIREAGVAILAAHGLRVLHPRALEEARRAGLRVVGDRVHFDRATIERFLDETRAEGQAEPEQTEERERLFRVFTCQYTINVHDLDTDTVVPMTTERLIEATKLIDALSGEGVVGPAPGIPSDVPDLLQSLMQYKVGAQYCRHGRHPIDARWEEPMPYLMEMAEVLGEPVRSLPVYVVSPLTVGAESLECVLRFRDRLSWVHAGNMPSVGGSAPIRLADAFALGIAEVAGAAMLLRAITKLPVGWGFGAMAFDLRGMAMSFGSPEHQLFRWATEEVSAYIHGRPLGAVGGYSSLRTQAKLPGPQAAAEKIAGAVVAALLGAPDLEGGGTLSLDEVFSGEQLVFDCEVRDHVKRLVAGVDGDCDPAEAVAEVGAGMKSGFMTLDSTLSTYRDVYWLPRLFERRALAGWQGAGCPSERDRAKQRVRELVAKHDFVLQEDLSRELDRIYERACRELA
ncbi:MAG: trimethylamine methyltransferase family protein [Armatimonadota bacterium]